MKFVDLHLGQPFRESTLGLIGRVTQVLDSYLLIDPRSDKMSTEVVFRRQITIQNLGEISAYHCPTVAEFEIPDGIVLELPASVLRYRSHLLGVSGRYRLGRFPLLRLEKEPMVDQASVVPLSEMEASTAQIELVQRSLDVELGDLRRRTSVEVTDPTKAL